MRLPRILTPPRETVLATISDVTAATREPRDQQVHEARVEIATRELRAEIRRLTAERDAAQNVLRLIYGEHGPLSGNRLGRPKCRSPRCVQAGIRADFPCGTRALTAQGLGISAYPEEAEQ